MTTSLEDLDFDAMNTLDDYLNNPESIDIFDMSIPSDVRINIINTLNQDIQLEYSNKLNSMYSVSGTTLIKKFIIDLVNSSNISSTLKIECSKGLCLKDITKLDNFKLLHQTLNKHQDIPIPCRVLAIIFLTKSSDFDTNLIITHFKNIINHAFVECDYKYKMILSLNTVYELDTNIFIYPLLMYFSDNLGLFTTYKILSCQNLLQNFKEKLIEDDKYQYIQNVLYSFASDEELDGDVRADATDVLLGLGDDEHKLLAREILAILGNRKHTLYDDQQNVHNTKIDESSNEILNKLLTNKLKNNISFDNIYTSCTNDLEEQIKSLQTKLDCIKLALNRINLDVGLYGNSNMSLKSVLIYIYNYISEHEHENSLIQRLKEELEEASGKCSTGYIRRLINVLSGFDDFSIKIGWDDEIIGKLSGRLNKLINEVEDEEEKEQLLIEMTLNKDSQILERKTFLRYFRNNIGDIREDIWKEVENDLSKVDFEIYFRKAMSVYEGIDFV
jgi:hypothetical protein